MRRRLVLLLPFFLLAATVRTPAQILPMGNLYEGSLRFHTNAPKTFSAYAIRYFNGTIRMQLTGYDTKRHSTVIGFDGSITNLTNGVILGKFPFSGRYRGRYDPVQNTVTGRFTSFTGSDSKYISRRRFVMTFTGQQIPGPVPLGPPTP